MFIHRFLLGQNESLKFVLSENKGLEKHKNVIIRVTRDSLMIVQAFGECRYSRLKRLFGGKSCKRGEIEDG